MTAAERNRQYRGRHPEKARESSRKCRARWRQDPKNKAVAKEQTKAWFAAHPGYRQKYSQKRRRNLNHRLADLLRSRIYSALNGEAPKSYRTSVLLGMDLKEFRVYIQGQFRPGMAWDNYGPVWHIDHVRPCASFDLTNPEEQKTCFRWDNLQPLFAKENLLKGAKCL